MLKPLVKQLGVTRTERYLAKISENAFFGLWSYPNVYRDEGLKKNGIGQEVADLIVFFGNDIIIFSDKDIAFPKNENIKISWGRWYRAAIKESSKQLFGAESFIRSHPKRLFLDKECSVEFPFSIDPNSIKIHLVALARNSSHSAGEYFDSFARGSSDSLIHSYFMDEKQALDNPFNVPDINRQKTFVHVFDDYSLDVVLLHLETVSDFINYLNEKESCVRKYGLGQVHGEEDFLAYYLNGITRKGFGKAGLTKSPKNAVVTIPEGWWRDFLLSPAYNFLELIRVEAQPWAKMVRNFSHAIENATVGEGQELTFLDHELVVRAMASENLISRRFLAKALLEKYAEVPAGVRSARLVWSISSPERLYIILFFPWSDAYDTYDEYRKNRNACMHLYAHVARYKYPESAEIIVIGLDTYAPTGSMGSSETIMAFRGGALSPQAAEEAKQIMEKESILRDIEPKNKKRDGIRKL